MVTARFHVAEVTRFAYNADNRVVKLRPSTKGEQNKAWAAATPSGEITMTIGNPAASAWFEDRLGQDVAITFDDVPQE
jgi:hypothetical protein